MVERQTTTARPMLITERRMLEMMTKCRILERRPKILNGSKSVKVKEVL